MSDSIDLDGQFKEIVRYFETAGITDPMLIAEYVAFFSLCWYTRKWKSLESKVFVPEVEDVPDFHVSDLQSVLPKQFFKPKSSQGGSLSENDPRSLVPSSPTGMQAGQLGELILLFNTLFENIPDLGEWFDQIALPGLFKTMQGGGRYPTPRHIERFLAHLAHVSEKDSIADFACGTGGLLVAGGRVARATGVEISPNMARLALTNLILHGQEQRNIFLGNTFYLAGCDDSFREARYDVILMNPPFGISLDPVLVDATFAEYVTRTKQITGRSETLFACLACEKLKSGGRMAVMVPSGVLFSNGSGERVLRDMLLDGGFLRAVISLPRDSTQPYSALPTHILYAVNPSDITPGSETIWFFRPRYDGFTSGRNRQPDPLENDLPIIEAAVNAHSDKELVKVIPLFREDRIAGYRVESGSDSDFSVRALHDRFLVKAIHESALIEWIFADNSRRKIYRGNSKTDINPLKMIETSMKTGKYNLLIQDDTDRVEDAFQNLRVILGDDQAACSLSLKKGKGEIRKGSITNARFGVSTKGEKAAFGILFDNGLGKPLSGVISFKVDIMAGFENPHYFRVFTGPNTSIRMLVLYGDEFSIYPLNTASGENIYMLETKDDDVLIFYHPEEGWIESSIELEFGINFTTEVFRSDTNRRGVVFDNVGEVLGISVTQSSIFESEEMNLQPEKYWIKRKQGPDIKSAARILGDIKISQNKLTTKLDRLLSIAELQPVGVAELPPRLHLNTPPPGLLHGIQQQIWDIVSSKTKPFSDYLTPVPFQADEIQPELGNTASVMDVQRTLELFERLGLIVSVVYSGYERALYYKLPSEREIDGAQT